MDRPLLISAVRHSQVRHRVVGVLAWAAHTEFDVPAELCWIPRRINRRRRGISEPRESIDAVEVRDQHQPVVPERPVMAAIIEDVERDLSRRRRIDIHVPLTGDDGAGNRIGVTGERTARNRSMVVLCGPGWLGGEQPRWAEQSHRDSCEGGYFQECFHSSFLSLSRFTFIFVMSSRSADDEKPCCWLKLNVSIFFNTKNGKHVRTHGLSGKSPDF